MKTTVYTAGVESKSSKTYTIGATAVTLTCTLNFGVGGTGPDGVTWDGLGALASSQYAIDTGSDSNGQRTTKLTFATVDSNSFAGIYTCKFEYTATHTHTDTVELVVRRKLK